MRQSQSYWPREISHVLWWWAIIKNRKYKHSSCSLILSLQFIVCTIKRENLTMSILSSLSFLLQSTFFFLQSSFAAKNNSPSLTKNIIVDEIGEYYYLVILQTKWVSYYIVNQSINHSIVHCVMNINRLKRVSYISYISLSYISLSYIYHYHIYLIN